MNTPKSKFHWVNSIGWGLFILLNTLIQAWIRDVRLSAVFTSISLGIVLYLFSIGFRNYIHQHQWIDWSPKRLIIPVIAAVVIMTLMADVVVVLLILLSNWFFGENDRITFGVLFANFINISLVYFLWSAIYFAYQYFKRYNKSEVEKLALQLQVKEAELGVLKSQINPHFMFNALNNIRALILENQEQARTMLTHLSDILRYGLSYTKSEMVSLESELEIVRYYFELASIQYEDRLHYSIEVPDDLRQKRIPPMLIQLLVENAIKHGISILPQGGNVGIKVMRNGAEIKIVVTNTGSLRPSGASTEKLGLGLANIRERLRLLYNGRAGFRLVQQGGEVVAEVILPDSM